MRILQNHIAKVNRMEKREKNMENKARSVIENREGEYVKGVNSIQLCTHDRTHTHTRVHTHARTHTLTYALATTYMQMCQYPFRYWGKGH